MSNVQGISEVRGGAAVAACPSFVAAMDIVGKRWNGLIIGAVKEGCASFGEIAAYAALSDAVLARRLRELESHGLIVRTVHPTRPPSVRYELTAAGSALAPILDALTQWGARYAAPQHVGGGVGTETAK